MKLSARYLLVVAVIIFADQLTKQISLAFVREEPMSVLPFFNWVLVWNRGISFGLFNNGDPVSPWLLAGFSLAIAAGLVIWLLKASHPPLRLAISAVIGGALGNVIDRLVYGAVVDFIDLHVFGYHWPAFNIADSAIVLGIAYIAVDSLFFEPGRNVQQQETANAETSTHASTTPDTKRQEQNQDEERSSSETG